MTSTEQLASLGSCLKQLLLASYGLYPDDLERELRDACATHLGSDEVRLLLVDYDQRLLLAYEPDDDRTAPVDGPGAGEAFRKESVVEQAADGRRLLWMPVKDSAERLGVLEIVDDGTLACEIWEAVASLIGELIVSKAAYGDRITLRKRRVPFSLAAEMRWALLPPLTFTSPDVTVAGNVQPSHGVAGDAFDYAVTGRTASMAILDAMGHGMEASRMANVAVAAYRNARRRGLGPAECLTEIDGAIEREFGAARFVTGQTAALDLDSGELLIANAGHPQPLLLRAGEEPGVVDVKPSRPAGLATTPTTTTVKLRPGDGVLFRTDGVIDARSPAGGAFGDPQLAALVGELVAAGLPASEVLRQAVAGVQAHQGERAGDDATLLLVRWRADEGTIT